MARRLTERQAEQAKDAIQAGVLIRALNDHIAGKRLLDASQVRAALGLLNKVLPDQKAVEHSGAVQVEWRLQLK